MNNNPIGLFDSGVGGLTVAKEMMKRLPNESLLYFGDTARLPYGSKSPEQILEFVREIMSYLLSQNVKMVVMACNTSSALALDTVKKEFPLPVVGLIQPGAKAAFSASRNGRIGVMATQATVNSHAYQIETLVLNPQVKVTEVACPRLVPLVESGKIKDWETAEALKEYLAPLQKEEVDTVILGCTHYPFLKEEIQAIVGEKVTLVDPAQALVAEVARILREQGLSAGKTHQPNYRYVVSGSAEEFARSARLFLSGQVETVEHQEMEKLPAGGN